MKKYLVVLAALALVFASCNPKEEEEKSALTGISFKQAEVSLMVGDTVQLALLGTPAGVEIPATVVFASSNEEVVKVIDNKVNIVGVGSGEANITAKVGELSAVCKVTVRSLEELWYPSDIFYFPDTKSKAPISDEVVEFEYPSGIYKCKFYTVTLVGVNGLDFDEDGLGEGYGWSADVTALFIEETPAGKEQFKGQIWDTGLQIVDESKLNSTHLGSLPGQMDPAIIGQVIYDAITGKTEKLDVDKYLTGVKGAHICYIESSDEGVGVSPYFDGIITAGKMEVTYDEEGHFSGYDYDITAQWSYGFYGYGIAVNPDFDEEDPSTYLKQPFELALSAPYHYKNGQLGQIVSSGAPAKRLARPSKAQQKANMIKLGNAKKLRAAKYSKEIQK